MNLRATQKFKARRLGGPGCSQKRGPKNQQGTWGFCELLKWSCRYPTFVAWNFKLGTGMARIRVRNVAFQTYSLTDVQDIWVYPKLAIPPPGTGLVPDWPSEGDESFASAFLPIEGLLPAAQRNPAKHAGHILVMIQPETILDIFGSTKNICQPDERSPVVDR